MDELLSPINRTKSQHLREGKQFRPHAILRPRVELSSDESEQLHDAVVAFLRSGEHHRLAEILQEQSVAIAHPTILSQILHLKYLASCVSDEEAGELEMEGFSVDHEKVIHTQVKTAAQKALQELVIAWSKGLLRGWTVQWRRQSRRGAPPQMSVIEAMDLLTEVDRLFDMLNDLNLNEMTCKRRAGESKEAFIERTAQLVQKLSAHCPWHLEERNPAGGAVPRTCNGIEFSGRCIEIVPLPLETARCIATNAVKKHIISKNDLIYGMLADGYYRGMKKPTQVRGLVERAEAAYPQYVSYRRSR